jgi:hypothetical protein
MIVSNWRIGEVRGELDYMAVELGTDKGSYPPMGHGYTRWYEGLLEPMRDREINLLEIGIGSRAPSLRLWGQYLPLARITGADVNPETSQHAPERAKVVICDCGNLTALAQNFADDRYDVIVDDGSHRTEDVFTALNFFWPRLKPGGWYAIEDLSCGVDDYFTDITLPVAKRDGRAMDFLARLELAFELFHARRLQIFPSQLRNSQNTGGQCLAVLHK